ncbi:hypothetical protein Holit_00891 [Hollandina sp. SP2]
MGTPFIHHQEPGSGFALLVFGAAVEIGPLAPVCFKDVKTEEKI